MPREFTVELERDTSFYRQIKRGDAEVLTGIKFRVRGTPLTGEPPESDAFYVDEYVPLYLEQILSNAEELLSERGGEFTLYNHKHALVFRPGDTGVDVAY
jgi:hypothetical protein